MQTERRTPLKLSGRRLVVLIAVVVVVLDQITKALAVATLKAPVDVIGSVLRLNLVRNPGAAFSFATSATFIFTGIALVAIVVIYRYAGTITSRPWLSVMGLILGGATGNLIDRLLRAPGFPSGHVVDFIQVPYWPIFNVADSAISTAVVIGIVLSLKKTP